MKLNHVQHIGAKKKWDDASLKPQELVRLAKKNPKAYSNPNMPLVALLKGGWKVPWIVEQNPVLGLLALEDPQQFEAIMTSLAVGWTGVGLEKLSPKNKALYAADCAEHVLPNFEKQSHSPAPRQAIQAVRNYDQGKGTFQTVIEASNAATSEAESLVDIDFSAYHAGLAAGFAATAVITEHAAKEAANEAVESLVNLSTRMRERQWQANRVRYYYKQEHPEYEIPEKIGAKLPQYKDPAIDPAKIRKLIKRGDTRALSNPQTPVDVLLDFAHGHPVEVENNPVLPMLALEDPGKYQDLIYSINIGWRINAVEKLDYNTRVSYVADCIEHAIPSISSDPDLAEMGRDVVAAMRNYVKSGEENWPLSVKPLQMMIGQEKERVYTHKTKTLTLRQQYFLAALGQALADQFSVVMAPYHLLVFTSKDEGLREPGPESRAEQQAQADFIRKYYYARFPKLPADIPRPRKKKKPSGSVGAVAPFGISDQAKNPNPTQLASFQILAPTYAENFWSLWRLYLLENPNIAITPGNDPRRHTISITAQQLYLYEEAFARLDNPNDTPLEQWDMAGFYCDCLEWTVRGEDDSVSRAPVMYAVDAMRGKQNRPRPIEHLEKAIEEIKKWYPKAFEELVQVQTALKVVRFSLGQVAPDKLRILHKLAWSRLDVVSEIMQGGKDAPVLEAYKAFAGFLEKRLIAVQGEVIAGVKEKKTTFPTLKKFLSLSQEKQNEIRDNNDAWLPSDMKGKRVYIHLNLGVKWNSQGLGTWSVKYGPTKKLVGHVYGMRLKNVTFEVAPSGNMEAIVAKEKIVHAFVVGDVVEAFLAPGWAPSTEGFIPVRYSPDRSEDFFFMRSSNGQDWDVPVSGASEVLAIGGIGRPIELPPKRGWRFTFPWKPILASGVQDMSAAQIKEGLEERRQAYLRNETDWEAERWKKDSAELQDRGLKALQIRIELEKAEKARKARFSQLGQSRIGGKSRRLQLPSYGA